MIEKIQNFDAIVVGSGLAGATAALSLAAQNKALKIAMVTATTLGEGCSSAWAQGGIAAAVGANDSVQAHRKDTLAVGGGINAPAVVESITDEGPNAVAWLEGQGVKFDRDPATGERLLGLEAGHSHKRIVHASGDSTGASAMAVLHENLFRMRNIRLFERHEALDLIATNPTKKERNEQEPEIRGAIIKKTSAGQKAIFGALLAPATILATGGIGQLFNRTTNPRSLSGSGLAIAARAGAVLADLEFIQFHPTALDLPAPKRQKEPTEEGTGAARKIIKKAIKNEQDSDVYAANLPMVLVTEALRGKGAKLINNKGEGFMEKRHPDAELAPRDVIARAVFEEWQAGHRPLLAAQEAVGAAFPRSFPTVYKLCQERGLNPITTSIPVVPAVHYHMGGVVTDRRGRTNLRGLWACGEVANTGLHGANRLASNSLLEAQVMGAAVAEDILGRLSEKAPSAFRPFQDHDLALLNKYRKEALTRYDNFALSRSSQQTLSKLVEGFQEECFRCLGLVRSREKLEAFLIYLERLERNEPLARFYQLRNMIELGRAIAISALHRTESRGAHFRKDFPQRDDKAFQKRFSIRAGGQPTALEQSPVPQSKLRVSP